MPTPRVAVGQGLGIFDRAGEQAAAERRISNEGDAELPCGAQRLFALGAVEQRKLVLHGRNLVHGVRAAHGLRARLAHPQRADLALLNQLRHGAHGILGRHGGIDAVLVVQIDHLDAQTLEARLAGTDDKFGTAVGDLAAAAAEIAELRRQNHFGAATFDGFADQLLIVAAAIGVGSVEHRDAAIQRLANERDPVIVVACAIDARERHAAEPDRRRLDTGRPERAYRKFFRRRHLSALLLAALSRISRYLSYVAGPHYARPTALAIIPMASAGAASLVQAI